MYSLKLKAYNKTKYIEKKKKKLVVDEKIWKGNYVSSLSVFILVLNLFFITFNILYLLFN